MDNIVREIVKTKIESFKGTGFQDALDRICLCVYGENGFQRVKQKKDGGSDGILSGTTILAAYAPEKYSLIDFKKKIGNDYSSYCTNWAYTHPNWQVVTNLESTSKMIQYVASLKKDSKIICIEALLQLISSQTWTVKLAIFRALDIPEKYIVNDVISTVVEDLILLSEEKSSFEPYDKPLYIKDKISLNVAEVNVDAFMEEYEESLVFFSTISHVIKSRSQSSVTAVRNKIRATYLSLTGTFEMKMNELVNILAQDKSSDDFYKLNMRIVMLYFFEQCLFGIKSNMERKSD